MRSRITLYLMAMALASFWAPAGAQDVEYERVVLRVISVNASGATVDRGSRDGVNVGDSVEFFPREGGVYRGTVTEVSDRRAVVRIDDPKFKPAAGSRGEALVPPSRFQIVDEDPEPEPEPEPDPKKTDPEGGKTPEGTKDPEKTDGAPDGKTPEHPPWKNKDEDYKEGKPLLAEV
ncbi:MAG: hypothetical protein OER88_14550, partial [Planctomycetota bacterium]|nr:hypothetical protein [Planctomycetota bacterium]